MSTPNKIIIIVVIILIIIGAFFLVSNNFFGLFERTNPTEDIYRAENSSIYASPTIKDGARDNSSHLANYVYVKYRDDKVDIAHPRFEYLSTSKSSWIRGAWYDNDNRYMIINLSGTNYHYCGMPASAWDSFKRASSFGTHYNTHIKGNYDCRIYYVPEY